MAFRTLIDLTGQRFGRLVVIERGPNAKFGNAQWTCRCDCGETALIVGSLLRSGNTRSCGCLRRETSSRQSAINAAVALGHAAARTPTYISWESMIRRTSDPASTHWAYYGGRGIVVCERWRSYAAFLADMGERPEGLTLDRIDVNGNYEPGNCRWATRSEQQRNQRRNRDRWAS